MSHFVYHLSRVGSTLFTAQMGATTP
eukprot:COSAG01_NODE_48567_length_380_cov_0.516014_1_plen_25_part_01